MCARAEGLEHDNAILRAGPWEAGLLPSLGGAIAYLTRDGRDVLRRAPEGVDDPLATGCFPLVPYANRIAHGRFSFAGAAFLLGAASMPVCCLLMAHWPKLRVLFAIPVLSLITGAILTLMEVL